MIVSHLCHCPGDPSQAQSVSQKAAQLACLSIGCSIVKERLCPCLAGMLGCFVEKRLGVELGCGVVDYVFQL